MFSLRDVVDVGSAAYSLVLGNLSNAIKSSAAAAKETRALLLPRTHRTPKTRPPKNTDAMEVDDNDDPDDIAVTAPYYFTEEDANRLNEMQLAEAEEERHWAEMVKKSKRARDDLFIRISRIGRGTEGECFAAIKRPIPGDINGVSSLLHVMASDNEPSLNTDNLRGKLLVLKVIRDGQGHSAEVDALLKLRDCGANQHPNIVHFKNLDFEAKLWFTLEFAQGGSLLSFVQEFDVDSAFCAHVFLEMSEALHELHSNRIAHSDLFAGNILIDFKVHSTSFHDFPTLKLGDFGRMRWAEDGVTRAYELTDAQKYDVETLGDLLAFLTHRSHYQDVLVHTRDDWDGTCCELSENCYRRKLHQDREFNNFIDQLFHWTQPYNPRPIEEVRQRLLGLSTGVRSRLYRGLGNIGHKEHLVEYRESFMPPVEAIEEALWMAAEDCF